MLVSVKVDWLKQFINKIDWKPGVDNATNKGIRKVVFYLQWEAVVFTPVDEGVLRNSFRQEFSNLYWELFNFRNYGVFVHEWTKFIKKKQPFMTQAVESASPKVETIMSAAMSEHLTLLN